MTVEQKFNTEIIAKGVFQEMQGDQNGFESFSDYWHRIRMSLQSRGVGTSEMTTLESLVMEKVQKLFNQAE